MNRRSFFQLSLRSKVVITLTLVVAVVSFILLYFTSKMILEDKKAYLFDNVLYNLETSTHSLNRFFDQKKNIVSVYQSRFSEEEIKKQISVDPDLYQVRSLTPVQVKNILEKQNEKPNASEVVFTNSTFLESYKHREEFLKLPDEMLALASTKIVEQGLYEILHFEKGAATRYLVLMHDPKTGNIYCFDFLMDKVLNEIFGKQSFEINFINNVGQPLFQNKPYNSTPSHMDFFKQFVQQELSAAPGQGQNGIREYLIGKDEYILGVKQINRFPGHFLFTGIKTVEAYEVTTLIIINTIIYAVCLIGFFNLLSIFLARSITNPLEKLTEVIKNIAGGAVKVRVGPQSTSELEVVGVSFNEMLDKIEDYREKLIEYNRTLEDKVEERTAELKQANRFIKSILDSLAQGLLVFDQNGKCLDLYTKACEKLIGTEPADKEVADLIKSEDKPLFNQWVQSLFEEMIPFESLVELGQRAIPCTEDYTSRNFKHVTLEFFPMRDDQNKVQNVIMVASDKTREFKANKEVEAQKNYVKLVAKVFKNKKEFLRFEETFKTSLMDEANLIKKEGNFNKDDLMRLLHSMKGSAAFYSLQEIVDYLHQFETDVSAETISAPEVVSRIDVLLAMLDKKIIALNELIGAPAKSSLEIDEKQLRDFWKLLHLENPELAKTFSLNFLEQDVEQYIDQYKVLTMELAGRLGKKVKPLVVRNGNLKIDSNYFKPFFDSCIHLFRNTVDHGIESPDVRLSAGKEELGNIHVSFELIESDSTPLLAFTVQDDGNGIDPNRIRNKMMELNYSEEAIASSDKQIIYHIFDSSFSTAETITDVSGRGVGLYDIKMNVEKLKGSIEVDSKVGKGTRFTFLIPLPKLDKKTDVLVTATLAD